MNEASSQPTDQQVSLQRILYSFQLDKTAPTVVFIAGIHGNEPAGIIGLQRVITELLEKSTPLKGNVYAIAGNLNALNKNIRFETSDLNRLWTQENIAVLNEADNNPERKEQRALYQVIKTILNENQGPCYFMDLHTTSAKSAPFITISDSLNNRKFAAAFDLPVILGIEEYLEGPLLTFINEFGHVSLGFEAGQHEAQASINNCIAFILKALVVSNCMDEKHLNHFKSIMTDSNVFGNSKRFYEVIYKHRLNNDDDFKMIQAFENFDFIKKGEILAKKNGNEIKAQKSGQIFMPLYQRQGNDGFFIISSISRVWILLSKVMRKLKLHGFLRLLPGVKQDPSNKYTLIVNPNTAKYLATEIFHLFGYRKIISKNNKFYFIRRDREITDFI